MKIKQFLLAAAALVFAVACEETPEPAPQPTPDVQVAVIPSSVSFVAEGGEQTVSLTAKGAWTATTPEWITLDKTSGEAGTITLKVTAAANTEYEAREADVVFTVGEQTSALAVSQAAAEMPGGDNWGIAGSFQPGDGWDPANATTLTFDGTYYSVKGIEFAAATEFKFVKDGAWTVNRGYSGNKPMQTGYYYAVQHDGGNIKVEAGTYDIYLNADADTFYLMGANENPAQAEDSETIEVTPEDPVDPAEVVWGIAGSFQPGNGWDAATATTLTFDGTYYSVKGVEFAAATDFKFVKDGAWTENRGYNGSKPMQTGYYYAVQHNGGNITVEAGTYDIYLNADADTFYLMGANENPAQAEDSETIEVGEDVTVIEFYASMDSPDNTPMLMQSMNLMDALSVPGQWFSFSHGNSFYQFMMIDHDYAEYGCDSYEYLTSHFYPIVAGDPETDVPTESCVLVHDTYTNFYINDVEYFVYIPDSETDAEGRPYGVNVMTMMVYGTDYYSLDVHLPIVDANGNKAILTGNYTGNLGYITGPTEMEWDFDMWGFTDFVASYDDNIVTLLSESNNGTVEFILQTGDGILATEEGRSYSYDDFDIIEGAFLDFDFNLFPVTAGGFTLKTVNAEDGTYKLIVEEEGGLVFANDATLYNVAPGEYSISIEGVQSEGGEEETVLTYYVDTTMSNGQFMGTLDAYTALGIPGCMFYSADAEGNYASIFMLDYDFAASGCESYSYLTAHHYPLVEGDPQGVMPTTSCVLAHPGYTNFEIDGVYYYPYVPESETDAEGNKYGIEITIQMMPDMDITVMTFNLPVMDDNGNKAVVKGSYCGELGFQVGPQEMEWDFNSWNFLEYNATVNGDVITLTSSTNSGDVVFELTTEEGVLATTEGITYVYGSTLVGKFIDFDGAEFPVIEGGIMLTTVNASEGSYTLTVGERRGLKFGTDRLVYNVDAGDYAITINGL